MGKLIDHGWITSSDEIPQPISVVMGKNLRKNSERPYHFSPVVDWLKKNGLPVTRKNYLRLAYPEGVPSPWTAEDEEGLPPELQRKP